MYYPSLIGQDDTPLYADNMIQGNGHIAVVSPDHHEVMGLMGNARGDTPDPCPETREETTTPPLTIPLDQDKLQDIPR